MSLTRWLLSSAKPHIERFPGVSRFYRAVRDQMDSYGEPIETPWGFHLAGNPMMAGAAFEPLQTRVVRELLSESDLLVNIGANIGYYCCHALSLGKPVIAFEPIQRNLNYLCRNVLQNGWSDVEIYPLALADRSGVLEIFGGDTGASLVPGWANISANYRNLVPCSTLDSVLGSRIAGKRTLFIVDIEGAERMMLDGALWQLRVEPKPVWIVEICFRENYPKGINPDFLSTFESFWREGYEAFSVDSGMRIVGPADVARWLKTGKRDFGYVTYLFRAKRQ